MRKNKVYLIYFLLFIWSVLSNMLPIIDSGFLARIWQLSTFMLIGFGGHTIFTKKQIYSNKIIRFLVLWLVYVLLINLVSASSEHYGFLDTFIPPSWWVIIFILFYDVFVNDYKDKYYKVFMKLYPLFYFLIFALVTYRMVFYSGIIRYGIIETSDINSVYWVMLLVPFAFLLDNRVLKYVILFSSLILIIASSKRGATIAISLVFFVAILLDTFKRKNFLRNIIIGIVLIFSFIFIFEKTLDKFNINVLDRFENTEVAEDARMYLYKDTWEKFNSKDLILQVIGSGHRSTSIDRGELSKTAHNDFLEVLYNYGILGLILYLYFILQILKRLKYLYKVGGKYFHAYLTTFIVFFVMSMISHLIIYSTYFAYLVILWALVEAKVIERKKKTFRNVSYLKS